MKKYIGIISSVAVFFPLFSYAMHDTQFVIDSLERWSNTLIQCDESVNTSVTFSDEQYRVLYSLTAGGTVSRDDIWAAHFTNNRSGLTQELYRYSGPGDCKCGNGCPSSDNVWWGTIWQDPGGEWPDSITLTGDAINKAGSRGGFGGYQYHTVWRLCHDKEIVSNGFCRIITGDINSDQSNCAQPCNPRISWTSQFARDIKVKKKVNNDPEFQWQTGTSNTGVVDSGLSAVNNQNTNYTYNLYGVASDGSNGSREFLLDSITVVVNPTDPVDCEFDFYTTNLNTLITISEKMGRSVNWSTSADANPSSSTGPGPSFSTSYSTTGSKTVTATASDGSSSGTCTVNVIVGSRSDIKANSQDSLSIPCTTNNFTLSWAPDPSSGTLTSCVSTGNWSGSRSQSGSVLISTGNISGTKTYGINCNNEVGTGVSDSVTVNVTGTCQPSSQETCSLSVSPSSVTTGGNATWSVTSQPSGFPFNWHGTDNGADIGSVAGGNTDSFQTFTYTQPANYTRYVTVNLPGGVCRAPSSGDISFSVTSGGGGTPPPPPGGGNLSCSAPGDTTIPYQTRVTVSGGRNQGYNWFMPGSCNATAVGSNWADITCNDAGKWDISAIDPVTQDKATCTFVTCVPDECPSPGGGPPPSPPAVIVKAATDYGDTYQSTCFDNDTGNWEPCTKTVSANWQNPLVGTSSINGVDLDAAPNLPSYNNIELQSYSFDCTSDGTIEQANVWPNAWDNHGTVRNLCNYSSPGTYTATAILYIWQLNICNPHVSNNCSPIEGGRGTATIQVNPPPEDFTIADFLWVIQSGTSRYRADYDYDNNAVLNKTDRDTLVNVGLSLQQCPQNKTCDVNNNGSITLGDASTYTTYLKTYDVQSSTGAASNAKAGIYFTSSGGATINLSSSGAPSGSSIVPSSVSVSGSGTTGSSELRLPTLSTQNVQDTFSITITGVAGGGTTRTSSPLTLNLSKAPAVVSSPTPDFSLNKSGDIFANIVGTQESVTSNSAKITVSAFDGFSSNVKLSVQSVSPLLAGATFNFSDSSLNQNEYLVGSNFSVTIPSNTPPGIYTITVRGVDGGLVRDANIRLNVNTKDPSFREI